MEAVKQPMDEVMGMGGGDGEEVLAFSAELF